jgi:hypothetical protein
MPFADITRQCVASAIMRKIVFPNGRKDLHHNGIFQDLGAVYRV